MCEIKALTTKINNSSKKKMTNIPRDKCDVKK